MGDYDDDYLRSLWHSSEEESSYFELSDGKGKEARREVMSHLVQMMASVATPKQGESTSNLYRILVKKLKNQIADLDNDPEIVDLATRKLAKWVEGLVKEAYYRKHRKPPQKSSQTEENTSSQVADKLPDIEKPKIFYKKPEESLQETVSNTKSQLQITMQDFPKSIIIDGKEYKFQKKEQQTVQVQKDIEESSQEIENQERNLEIKVQGRPNTRIVKQEIPPNQESSVYYENDNYANNFLPDKEEDKVHNSPSNSKDLTEKVKRVLFIKSHNYNDLPAYNVEVESLRENSVKILEREIDREICKPEIEDMDCISGKNVDNSAVREGSSAAPLVRNWSSWMVDLTRKAKSLVKWDNKLDTEVRITEQSDAEVQEKWQKLVDENEAKKKAKSSAVRSESSAEDASGMEEQNTLAPNRFEGNSERCEKNVETKNRGIFEYFKSSSVTKK